VVHPREDVDLETDIVAKRVKHDEADVSRVMFEAVVFTNCDLGDAGELIDQQAKLDETWLWEEPTLHAQLQPTEDEIGEARAEEVRNLTDFNAYEWQKIDEVTGGMWIRSRWEEGRKDSGVYRSRWVLQEFANYKGERGFFLSNSRWS
jgi:hypothetical protein